MVLDIGKESTSHVMFYLNLIVKKVFGRSENFKFDIHN